MQDRWTLFAVGLAVLTAALVIGWRASRHDRKAATAMIILCLVPVLVRTILIVFPSLEYRFLCQDGYALLRPWWSVPFAIALFTTASPHMGSRISQAGLVGLSLLLWLSGTDRLLATAQFDPQTMDGVVDADGVCMQTTDYTCGAAAAATLLVRYGVTTDEREMAEACWTNSLTGTDELCVARGLRRKLSRSGLRLEPRISMATWDELCEWDGPAAVTIKDRLFVDHWIVVLEIRGERVTIGDPTSGLLMISKDAFLEVWRGRMVTLRGIS